MGSILPAAGDVLASSTAGATSVFNYFSVLIWFILGIVIGVLVVKFVGKALGKGAKSVLKRRKH